MSSSPLPPDRYSNRSAAPTDPSSEFSGLYRSSAPESMPLPASYAPFVPERRRRVAAGKLQRLPDRLSTRDRAVLQTINRYGFATTSQLRILHFTGHQSPDSAGRIARRVLKRLADWQLVEALGRRVGGWQFGSDATIWRLGLAGDRLLREAAGLPRRRFKQPSPRFVDHRLTIVDCLTLLSSADQTGDRELLQADPEPDSWRSFLAGSGSHETLKPDLYAVTASSVYEDHWFLEIDRSTESLPTIRRKCLQYETCRPSGREQATSEVFPYVVWVTPDDVRSTQLTKLISTSADLDDALYRVTSVANLLAVITGGSA